MRTSEEHGAGHVHEIVIDDDAYNAVGQRLRNDDRQAKRAIAASVIGGIVGVVLVLVVLL